ncbi:unnamed protein product [Cylindrotheca closterium]|uniref:SET domain-containing protein n=1 Tax=Cylindrotheca closterium TaxID=2856 RepID=A0AAD2PVL6_9STRA|nr:unnamed protein product [Cylindrotheca closterium]
MKVMPWQTSCHHDISKCSTIPSSVRYAEEESTSDSKTETIKNRFAIANQEFQPGEIVLRNAPLACSLFSSLVSDRQQSQSQRCAYCFVPGSEQKLSRCGRCQSVWYYCSRDCQKKDFPLHKKECIYWTTKNKDKAKQLNGRIRAEISLLIRTYAKIEVMQANKQQGESSENTAVSSQSTKNTTIIQSGIQHLASLSQYPNALDSNEQSIITEATTAILIWSKHQEGAEKKKKKEPPNNDKTTTTVGIIDKKDHQNIRQQMEDLLRIFRVNNFGITDELLKVIASAVYPLGALLNHSCRPNCILRYSYNNKKAPPVLEIVASRCIQKGEELTHSYVELVKPQRVRKERLQSNYGFECHCHRCCSHNHNNNTSNDWMQLQDSNQVGTFLDHSNPTFAASQTWTPPALPRGTNHDDAHGPLREMAIQLQAQAKQCMAMDNIEGELMSLTQCVGVLSQLLRAQLGDGSNQGHDDDTLHQTCLELYQVRGDLLGTLIVAGQTKEAIQQCEYVVAFLVSILCDKETANCPNHPILGLQLFTLGDLYTSVGWDDKAQRTFAWARKIMLVSHGKDSDMVKLLKDR